MIYDERVIDIKILISNSKKRKLKLFLFFSLNVVEHTFKYTKHKATFLINNL